MYKIIAVTEIGSIHITNNTYSEVDKNLVENFVINVCRQILEDTGIVVREVNFTILPAKEADRVYRNTINELKLKEH